MRQRFEGLSRSPEETYRLGEIIGEQLVAGDIVALIGDLGAGKTTLTQGIAHGLAVPESYAVTSPTFTLVNEYPGRLILYHVDVYRLSGIADLETIGYEEYFFADGVTVIEWADKIEEILKEDCILIELDYMDETIRRIKMIAYKKIIDKIKESMKGGSHT